MEQSKQKVEEEAMTADLQRALNHWAALGEDLHRFLRGIETDADYDRAAAVLEELDRLSERDPRGPHVTLAALLADKLSAYDERHEPPTGATPGEVLAFLMRGHGLNQSDLSDLADQGTISKIVAGKRAIGKKLAGALGRRFEVDKSVFL